MTSPLESNERPDDSIPEAPTTPAHLAYSGPSRVATVGNTASVELYGNLDRKPLSLTADIENPLRFREAMSALYGIIGSDYRYVPKDRTQYLAYMRMKRETASMGIWQAQQAHFAWMLRNDPTLVSILDPVTTIHPDQVFFEVFSKDESTYANLAFTKGAFKLEGEPTIGTTNIDFSPALFESIQQMRSYRATKFRVASAQSQTPVVPAGNQDSPGGKVETLEKKMRVPDSWLRGFLQVQSAATLPMDHVQIAPMDLYNMLRELRMHSDIRNKRRGLRLELVPAENPRIVLEPWETVIPTTAGMFKGKQARVVRLWGRRRLMLVKRLLPFVETVDIYIMGSGLPSFWVMRAGDITLTIGLTGFTSANWSQALSFDLLLPRKTQGSEQLTKVTSYLEKNVWLAPSAQIAKETGLKKSELAETLQLGCQHGQIMYDIANDVYRLRPLTEGPLDLLRLQYRNQREKIAHDLLTRRGAVKIVSENRIAGVGLEIVGKVSVEEDKRDYRPQMVLADEGQVRKVECTCSPFRKHGIKAGPCIHLIALRLAYAEREARKSKGDDTITVETRAFSRRDEKGETMVQVSLERQKIKIRWGRAGDVMRVQTLRFNTVPEAREAYFTRITDLDAKGYLDATEG